MDENPTNADEQFELGKKYNYGDGIQKDPEKAVYWYTKAAEQSHAEAQCCLGMCYTGGFGVLKNYEMAIYWLTKSEKQGYETAKNLLAMLPALAAQESMNENPTNAGEQYELGLYYISQHDDEKAAKWITKAAEQGYAVAQFELGTCYSEGALVLKDLEKAVYWYTKAAEQGNADAQFKLGCNYVTGKSVNQDFEKAKYWITKAAEQGDNEAQESLKSLAELVKSELHQIELAEQGDDNLQVLLGLNYAEGKGVPKSQEKAAYWFTKAAERGNDIAQLKLGICYFEGKGVNQDFEKAKHWLIKAVEQDNNEAQEVLKQLPELKKSGEKTPSSATEATQATPDIELQMKRGKLSLEDSDWEKADEYFDRVLDIAPKYAPAYVGKLCAELKVRQEELLEDYKEYISGQNNFQKAFRFASADYKAKLKGYDEKINERLLQKNYNGLVQDKNRASTENEYQNLARKFRTMNGYKNTIELANECDNQYHVLKERREEQERIEYERREEQERIKAEKAKKKRIITIAVIITAIGIVVGYIVYNSQENSIIISDGVTLIKEGEFTRKQLVSVEIPDSVTSISNNAFKRNKLTSIKIPSSVTSIGESAFAGNQLTSIAIGANVSIGPDAFGSWFETFYDNNGKAAGMYRRVDTKSSEWNVWHDNFKYKCNNGNITIIDFNGTGSDIVIPDEISGYPVKIIGKKAFFEKKINSVIIPNSVTTIEEMAFFGQWDKNRSVRLGTISNVTFGNSVTTIGDRVFENNLLSNITIPNSVTSIGISAFADNPITSIKIGANVKLAEEPGANGAGVLGRRTGFNGAYANNGRRAGTYTRPNTNSTTWTRR